MGGPGNRQMDLDLRLVRVFHRRGERVEVQRFGVVPVGMVAGPPQVRQQVVGSPTRRGAHGAGPALLV